MADGDFNLATLWVPVAPDTSKVAPAMEEAGKQAKSSFAQSTKDIGKPITDDLEKSSSKTKDIFSNVGQHITGVFHRSGKEAGDNLTNELEKSGSKVEGRFAGVGHKISDIFAKAGADSGKSVDGISGALQGVKGHLDGVEKAAGKVGIDIGGWLSPLTDATNKASEAKGQIGQFAGIAKDLPGKLGEIGGKIGGWAGPLAAAYAGFDAIQRKVADISNHVLDINPNKNPYGWWGTMFGAAAPLIPGVHPHGAPTPPPLPTGPSILGDAASGQPSPPPPPSAIGDAAAGPAPMPLPSGGSILGDAGALGPLASPPPDAAPSAGPADSGGPLSTSNGVDWDKVAAKESSGNWQINSGNGYYGGLQFDLATWRDFGGTEFAERPDLATKDQQIAVANRVPVDQRWRRWPKTYQFGAGGRRPDSTDSGGDDTSGGSSGASNSRSSGGSGGGGGGGSAGSSYRPSAGARASGASVADFFARSVSGKPYSYGGYGDEGHQGLFDCSGFMSAIYSVLTGKAMPGQVRFFSTESDLTKLGFVPTDRPMPGTFQVGIHHGGGGMNSHMAGTLPSGVNVESGGAASMTQYGGAAAGAWDKQFESHYYLPGRRGSAGGGADMPVGTEHDPLYVTTTGGDSAGGGSELESQGQQLGQGLLSGLMQSIGLDGSVFKGFGGGKSPLDFGITKLGTGLLNWGMGMSQHGGGDSLGADLGDGGGGGMMPGLGSLIPALSPGAMISAGVAPSSHGSGGGAAPGPTTIINGDVNSGLSVTQHGVQNGIQDWQHAYNGRVPVVSNAGGGPLP